MEHAAKAEGLTFSAWLARTAAHRLKLDAGRQGLVIAMAGVTYDTGALVAADRNDRKMWALRLLRMCDVEPLSGALAKDAGVLAGRAKHDDVVDVTVVEGAIRRADAVVTSDAGHVRKIAAAAGVTIWIEPV